MTQTQETMLHQLKVTKLANSKTLMFVHDSDLPVDVIVVDTSVGTATVYSPDVDANWVSDYTSGALDDVTDDE